jgi:hypothetical protein
MTLRHVLLCQKLENLNGGVTFGETFEFGYLEKFAPNNDVKLIVRM